MTESCPGFEPAARLLKRFLICKCVSLLWQKNSLLIGLGNLPETGSLETVSSTMISMT